MENLDIDTSEKDSTKTQFKFKGLLTIHTVKKARILSQTIFLLLFLFLLTRTEYRGTFARPEVDFVYPPYPVNLFFKVDPLVAISTAISTHSLYNGLIWSLIIIFGTLIIGRFFCGWICPLGTLNHLISSIYPSKPLKERIDQNRTKRWQKVKFYILIGMLTSAILTTLQVGLLDPISFLYRSISFSILPAISYGLSKIVEFFYETGIPILPDIINYLSKIASLYILPYSQPFFYQAWLFGGLFLVVLILNRYITRFWCRSVCPLGALLGLLSRFSLFGIEKRHDLCIKCNKCLHACQGASSPQGGIKWLASECHLCFNCQAICPTNVIRFRFFPELKKSADFSPDLMRRRVLLSTLVGFSLFPLSRSTDIISKRTNPRLIRPPSSLKEEEFLKRCIKCGECMKICPTNALHPALFEAGIEGIWTPFLIPILGYCEQTCVLCSQICPTGAIQRLSKDEKIGLKGPPLRIGLAFIDRGRCLPWAMNTECIVCEEHCPTSPKAIWFEETTIIDRNGKSIELKRPFVDPTLCWGCGICENKCPIHGKKAIYITNAGESRSYKSQIILEGKNLEM